MSNIDKRIEKGLETKENIVRSAIVLFSEKGYDGTSVQDISARAGIPKSLFYHYFKTKEDVLKHIIHRHELGITDEEVAASKRMTPDRIFQAVVSRLLSASPQDTDILKIVTAEALRSREIFCLLLEKAEVLRKGFLSIMPEDARKVLSDEELAVYSFYFRFMPEIIYLITKDSYASIYQIAPDRLDEILLKLVGHFGRQI